MCGISGFNWRDEKLARRMVSALAHRGPDAEGVFVDEGISLGHNRLSIIDLSAAANQPMEDAHGELVLVFNGEIYNYRELRAELEGEYVFKTKSDTEVILAGYRKWGPKVVERLNGMFGFALWDKRAQELFCARDHAGIKPFYYFWDGERFIFASEIKGILAHDVPRVLDQESFNEYMRVLYVPEPRTMLKQVYKLAPSSTLTLKGGALAVEEYAGWPEARVRAERAEAATALREEVCTAVERQLVADVPVGVYLSGGIDSSAVLAAASRVKKNIETFSVGFALEEGEEGEKFNADFELAARTAAHFGAKHHALRLTPQEVLAGLEEAAAQCDDPVSNPTSVPMLLLARFAKKRVSVVLTGSGGDELFGGYDRYRLALAAHYYQKLPRVVRAVLNLHPRLRKLDQDAQQLFVQFLFQKDKLLRRALSPEVFVEGAKVARTFERYVGAGDAAEALMRADQRSWLPDFFFLLSDKMSMRSALEERVPLMDRAVVAFSRATPRRHKVSLFHTKILLKEAFRHELPEFLFNQPKRGWFSPGAKWLRRPEFAAFARRVLAPEYHSATAPLFAPELQNILERHINKEEYNLTLVWAVLTFRLWAKAHDIRL